MDLTYMMRKRNIEMFRLICNGKESKTTLANKTGITYSHTVKVLSKLKGNGIIRFEREGRTVFVYPTERGMKVFDCINQILKVVKK